MLEEQFSLKVFAFLLEFGVLPRECDNFLLKLDNFAVSVKVGHWRTGKRWQACEIETLSRSVLAFAR